MKLRNRDSVVGIVTEYELDDKRIGVRAPGESRICSESSRRTLEPTQSPIQWVPGALSPGVQRPGREADHLPPIVPRSRKCVFKQSLHIRLHGVVLN
jgi:hypothetical protein